MFQPPIITVIGKAFFDVGHAAADHAKLKDEPRRLRCNRSSGQSHSVLRVTQHGGKHSSNKLCISQI